MAGVCAAVPRVAPVSFRRAIADTDIQSNVSIYTDRVISISSPSLTGQRQGTLLCNAATCEAAAANSRVCTE